MVQQAFRVDNLSTSNIEFKANSFVSSLVANTALASNVHLVLPGSVGTSGQVLATDGSGNLSFINQGIGGPADTVQDNVNATSANVNLVQSNVTSLTSTVDSFGIYANNTFGADGSNVSVANVTSQEFSLDGSTNTFTLVNSTDNVNKLLVSYGGIAQKPSEYQVSNTTLTLSNTRPLVSGTTLEVRFLDFEFAGSVTNTGNAGVVAGGATTVIAPIAFGSVADITSGSGTNLNWANWNSGNSSLDFTFDTPQPDTNYTVVTDCEVFDDVFVQITNKTTTGFRASFYNSSQNLQPSSFREFTFIVYGSTPTVDINSLSGTSYSTTLYSNLAAGTTTFNANSTPALATYTAGKIGVYRNGVKLPSTDYTASDGTSLTLNNATLLGDSIEVVNFGTLSLALDDITDVDLTTNSPSNGQALVYVSASSKWVPGTVAGSYGNSDVDTHLNQSTATTNQVLSWDGSDYAWVDQSAGGASSGAALTEYEFTATANQTSFAATYIPNSIQVFLNGVKLANTDFTATNGTSVVLGANTASGDIVAISKIGGSSNLTVANASASGSGSISYDSGSEILTYTPPDLSGYQSTLVSNTNIKTINGTSLLGSGDISTGGGVAGTLGSLTKTFSNNETATITLSSNVSPVPNVSVFKEIPQPGVSSKGSWDVNANATNYEFFDEKPISYPNVTLTPSATGDGTFSSGVGYSLSAPSFGSSFNVGSQAGNPQEVVMKTDGTKMYVLDVTTKTIFEYDLSTNFDSSTATYNSVNSGSLGTTVAGDPYGLRFKPDGTKLYICAYNDILYQFSLGTAWDLSTISADNDKIIGFSKGNIPYCLAFKPDGTKVYTVGYRQLYEWVLPTAWSLSGAIWTSAGGGAAANFLSFGGYITPNSVFALDFSADGTKFFVHASGSGTVGTGLFEVPIDSAWDPINSTQEPISTDGTLAAGVTRYDALNTAHGSSNLTGFAFVNNGQQAVVCYSGAQDYVYTLNTLEALSFSSADVGKKVVGNSGTAIITSTAGAYTSVTPFADTSAISSWQLYGAEGKSDGTGIQLAGYSNKYDLVNATYTTISPYLNQATGYSYMFFKPDGTKVWVGGQQIDTIYEYDLSTGFDLSTITYGRSFAFATSTQSRGFFMKSDGTRAYIADFNSAIRQLDLSTAWNISTATYNSVSTGTGYYNGGIYIKSDGTKLYSISQASVINEYTLSTPWDLSNKTLDNTVTLASPVGSQDIFFSPDGTKFFIPHNTSGRFVNAYSLSIAWDTSSTITFITSFSLPEIGSYTPQAVSFNTDGSAMYVINGENASTSPARRILEYATGSILHPYSQYFPALTNSTGQIDSSSWVDLNSMVADETKNDGDVFYAVSTDNRTNWGVIKDGDGVRKIARNNSGTWQYNNDAGTTVTVAFDIANASYDNKSFSVTAQEVNPRGIDISADGTVMIMIGNTSDDIFYYTLSTPFDVSTASYTGFINQTDAVPNGCRFGDNGTKIFVPGNSGAYKVESIPLSTAYDVSTAGSSTLSSSLNTLSSGANISLQDVAFKTDGTKMYILDFNDDQVHEYSLSTAWDISTLAYTTAFSIAAQELTGQGLDFSSDGTKMFVVGQSTDTVYQYNLSTAWDVSSASYSNISLTVSAQETGPGAICFGNNGQKMYIVGTIQDTFFQYSTGSTTIGYSTSETWVNGTNNNEHATLQEALGAQSFNRMDKAQLQAVTDPNHYVLGNTLDLMIAPYATSGISPLSDGVTINYDAEALVEQAINGTDYKARFPTANSVSIISLADQNLKVRVI